MTQDAYLFELYLHLNRVNKGSKDMHYNSEDALFGGGILRMGNGSSECRKLDKMLVSYQHFYRIAFSEKPQIDNAMYIL